MKYANLVIDNKSDQTDQLYTYGVKDDAKIGSKVYVPFARSRNLREAYVVETDEHSAMGWENGCAISKRWTMMFPSARR